MWVANEKHCSVYVLKFCISSCVYLSYVVFIYYTYILIITILGIGFECFVRHGAWKCMHALAQIMFK